MSLQFLLDSQEAFQKRMGHDFSQMSEKELSAYKKEHGYFLIEETTEFLREMPFHKSWKDYDSWTREDFERQQLLQMEEAIDAFHFLLNLFLSLGMDEETIISMYKDKNKINYLRQEQGY